MHTTVLDHDGLLALFRELAGRRLVGAIDGHTCVELVLTTPTSAAANLVSIFTEGRWCGAVAHGSQDLIEGR